LALFLGFGLALLLNQKLRFLGLDACSLACPMGDATSCCCNYVEPCCLRPTERSNCWICLHLPCIFQEQSTDWLGDFNTALPTVILIGAWVGMPVITVSILAALQGIPTEMVEASVIDGANAWQRFRYITSASSARNYICASCAKYYLEL
jgi:multiple sugar transport system permease protein